MADQPDPPEKWRVYQEDATPDPEPEAASAPPPVPYGNAPDVPYGSGRSSYDDVFGTPTRSSVAPKLVLVMVGLVVLGIVSAVAVAIFAAVGSGGIGAIGGIDAKDPDDFAELVEKLEDKRGSTEVNWVGLYTDYIIVDVPYTDDPADDREISYSWRGGDLEESNKGKSTDQRFDLTEIDPQVIDGMCDTVLSLAEGSTPDDCYVFISKPAQGSDVWFRTSATDEFTTSYWVNFDKDGNEVERGHS